MWGRFALLGLLWMGTCMHGMAADATSDGRVFQYLSVSDAATCECELLLQFTGKHLGRARSPE